MTTRMIPFALTAAITLLLASVADGRAQRRPTSRTPTPTARATGPTVQSVSPEEARLVPAGASVVVTLTGQGLTRLSGAQVVSRGRPVPNVTARLTRTSSTTERKVEIEAASGAAAGTYELVLTAPDPRRRTRRISTPLRVVVPPPAVSAKALPADFDTRTDLQLEVAAGDRATIEVRGSRLDRPLTDLRIESGGRPVGGLRATALSRSPETLVLEVAVDSGVTLSPDGPYELVAYDDGRRLSVPVDLVIPSTPQPDPYTAAVRVATPELRMTGLRFPIEVETPPLRMTGIREENP